MLGECSLCCNITTTEEDLVPWDWSDFMTYYIKPLIIVFQPMTYTHLTYCSGPFLNWLHRHYLIELNWMMLIDICSFFGVSLSPLQRRPVHSHTELFIIIFIIRASEKTAIMLHWSSNVHIFVLIKLLCITYIICIIYLCIN